MHLLMIYVDSISVYAACRSRVFRLSSKNGQSRLELPTHLSLQNPTSLPLPCFALSDFVVVTSGENKYSLCSCLFSCWCSKLCDFFFLALNFASIDVNRCFFSFLSNEVHPVYLLWKSWTAAMNESCLHERIHGYRTGQTVWVSRAIARITNAVDSYGSAAGAE